MNKLRHCKGNRNYFNSEKCNWHKHVTSASSLNFHVDTTHLGTYLFLLEDKMKVK